MNDPSFDKFRVMLREMSQYLNDATSLPLKSLSSISLDQLNRAWKLTKEFEEDIYLYEKRLGKGFIMGKIVDDKFHIYVDVAIKDSPIGIPKIKKTIQVELVNASSEFTEKGYAKKAYLEITKHYTLVSDSEQFIASKRLWQSIAREPEVNVYIYDSFEEDFLRNEEDSIISYNGKNIDEKEIWGKDGKHINRLLVGTIKDIF